MQNAGQQLSENIVVEKAYFYNTVNNNTACQAGPGTTHCGGVLYVRNTGLNPILLETIYIGNVTSPNSPAILTVANSAPFVSCSSNQLQPAKTSTGQTGQICFFTFINAVNLCPGHAAGALYCNNLLPMAAANEIMPGQVDIIHFMLPDSSYCPANPLTCTVAYPGTTYAFTLVTSRGNNFVVYETA